VPRRRTRSEDLTFDKTDEKDAVLIARLTAQLRCYIPEPVDETSSRLRDLGARRELAHDVSIGSTHERHPRSAARCPTTRHD
jgi:hypothetical protein